MTQFKEFTNRGAFAAITAAEKYCESLGYKVGIMDGSNPIGIAKNVNYVSKWHNFRPGDEARLGGTITSQDFRSGPVLVSLYESATNA